MNRQHSAHWKSCFRRAFTLVEVVASLLLLGTLLVGILVAHRRHAQQIRRAQAKLEAVAAADQLLSEWSAADQWGAAMPSGRVTGNEHLSWRWTVSRSTELRSLGAAIGRLEIFTDEDLRDGTPSADVDVLAVDALPVRQASGYAQ